MESIHNGRVGQLWLEERQLIQAVIIATIHGLGGEKWSKSSRDQWLRRV